MALDFPSSPALNQVYTFGSYSWRWDGTSWVGAVPIVNATINNTTIGVVTPSVGNFTTIGATTQGTGAFTTLSASSTSTLAAINSSGVVVLSSANGNPLRLTGTTTDANSIIITNTGGTGVFGMENSTGGNQIIGSTAYDLIVRGPSGIAFSANAGSNMQMRLSSTGLAVTGAVTATGNVGLASGTLLTLNSNNSAASYAIQAATSASPYDFRFIGDSDSITQRNFSFGYYTGNSSGSAWNPKVTINSYTGNVGIGTTSPGYKLDVSGELGATNAYLNNITLPASGSTIGTDSLGSISGAAFQLFGTTGGKSIYAYTNGSTRLIIDSNGNVGIGNSSPASDVRLTSRAPSSSGYNLFLEQNNGLDGYLMGCTSVDGALTFSRRATSGTVTIERARITPDGNLGIGTTNPTAKIYAVTAANSIGFLVTDNTSSDFAVKVGASTGVVQVGSPSGAMSFSTLNTERARIDTGGRFMVGTTSAAYSASISTITYSNQYGIACQQAVGTSHAFLSDAANSSGTYKHFIFLDAGTFRGDITSNGVIMIYGGTSDYRLKDITGPLTDSGAFIDALKPKVGTWKSNGSKFAGFLAHEFAEVSPSSVSGEKDAVDEEGKPKYQSMQASSAEVIANLVAEIQQLRKRMAAVESK
jgi:Chaperone of endosialidase